MELAKANIIHRLKREILPLEGLKVLPSDVRISLGIPFLDAAFPYSTFPVGCMHEFICDFDENGGASYGFLYFLLQKFMCRGGIALWIGKDQNVFPGALKAYGIDPQNIVFVNLKKEKDILFALEESLKCAQLTAVIGELGDLDFKQSRRLQLAAEKSRVTGFIIRKPSANNNTVACVSRWHITSLPSETIDHLPGVGHPRWEIDLQKIRNGTPGKWKVEWKAASIQEIQENVFSLAPPYQFKTG